MNDAASPVIACKLPPANLRVRLAWIERLTREGLRDYHVDDLTLRLSYAPEFAERVRELVRRESDCCGFLSFDIEERPDAIALTVTAPEAAREAAADVFAYYLPREAAPQPTCGPTTSGGVCCPA